MINIPIRNPGEFDKEPFMFMILRYFLFILLMLPSPLVADSHHNYDETRIHNEKTEERFKDWHHRAKKHANALRSSDHAKIKHWRDQLKLVNLNEEISGLHTLNRLINSDVRYVDDFSHFHVKDFWDDPETTLEEGGDCEDIALLKAATLHMLDWPEERMHLLVGYLLERGKPESHAVLLVETHTGEQHILRSITDQVVYPDQFNFLPIYAVDSKGTLIVKNKETTQ